ncbi:MAG: hypothetical protein WCK02_02190 [Bacteroidota bacterium]
MAKIKVFKRNKQLGKTLLILAFIIGLTLVFHSFYIDNIKIRLAQYFVFSCLLFFAFLEFTIPFAIITSNHIIIRESPFLLKKILKVHIREVNSFKGRFVIVYCKTWRKKIIYLKSIDINQKAAFIKELTEISNRRNNSK